MKKIVINDVQDDEGDASQAVIDELEDEEDDVEGPQSRISGIMRAMPKSQDRRRGDDEEPRSNNREAEYQK